jgi:hypothetical protein
MKPRMRQVVTGLHECSDGTSTGYGVTRFQAWMSWLRMSLSRYDFEGIA